MQLIDTHTHLATAPYNEILTQTLERSRQADVTQWITIGTNLKDSQRGIDLSSQIEDMFCSVGIHPHEAGEQPQYYLDQLASLAESPKVCAIGEIGLDYHYDFSDPKIQKRIFMDQLDMSRLTKLPIVIHCREAVSDCLAILKQWNQPEASVVFHCFTSDKKEAKAMLDQGHWISFTGTITFKNTLENQKAAQYVPLDRMMLETDCPYLSPAPMRKVKPNEPALLVHTADKLADLRGKTLEEIAETTTRNSRYFYKLDEQQERA